MDVNNTKQYGVLSANQLFMDYLYQVCFSERGVLTGHKAASQK